MIIDPSDRRSQPGWQPHGDLLGTLERVCAPAGRAAWKVGWVLVGEQEIADLNWRYRQTRGATDVLSFSYLQTDGPGSPQLMAGDGFAWCDLWLDPVLDEAGSLVGEIVIAPDFVTQRCRENGWSVTTEMALLTVHGALHILGWEHSDPSLMATMRAHEATLLELGGFSHPLLEGGNTTDGG